VWVGKSSVVPFLVDSGDDQFVFDGYLAGMAEIDRKHRVRFWPKGVLLVVCSDCARPGIGKRSAPFRVGHFKCLRQLPVQYPRGSLRAEFNQGIRNAFVDLWSAVRSRAKSFACTLFRRVTPCLPIQASVPSSHFLAACKRSGGPTRGARNAAGARPMSPNRPQSAFLTVGSQTSLR
jgi:hypothetical protein